MEVFFPQLFNVYMMDMDMAKVSLSTEPSPQPRNELPALPKFNSSLLGTFNYRSILQVLSNRRKIQGKGEKDLARGQEGNKRDEIAYYGLRVLFFPQAHPFEHLVSS